MCSSLQLSQVYYSCAHACPQLPLHALHHSRLFTCLFMMQSTNFDLEFVHINCQSLAASVRDEALGWVQALSQCMRELDMQSLEVCGHHYTMPSGAHRSPGVFVLMVYATVVPPPSRRSFLVCHPQTTFLQSPTPPPTLPPLSWLPPHTVSPLPTHPLTP